MDLSDYTRILYDKIQKFETENPNKIVGYLYLQDHPEQEIPKLASFPDHLIKEVVLNTKMELQKLAPNSLIFCPALPPPPMNPPQQGLGQLPAIHSRSPTSPASFSVPRASWESESTINNANTDFMAMGYLDSIPEHQKQTYLLALENHIDHVNAGTPRILSDCYGLDASMGNLNGKAGRRFSSLSEFPVKTCHYFSKGYCKHGSNCRYYHGQVGHGRFSQMYGNDGTIEDPIVSPGSLAQLELEIVELLKLRRGNPITIASLPLAYFDKYKKVLQADGYLTESQRHGKSGYSLTKLLAQLKNSIRLIDRPHGQHAVVLAEDAPKYMERGDPGQNISASRQIYLTFPAVSTFTEEDVSNYFKNFGSVEDVRIPCQRERMFGFVTFADPETVRTILEASGPHFVRGSRVLVKPYRERPKLNERKYSDRIEPSVCYSPQYMDQLDSELNSSQFDFSSLKNFTRNCQIPRHTRKQIYEEQEKQALKFQQMCLSKLQLAQKPLSNSPYLGFSPLEEPFNFQPAESVNHHTLDKPRYIEIDYTDEDSNQVLNLPESPFAFPIDSGISAYTYT